MILLALISSTQAQPLSQIDPNTWPTQGPATAATTGLDLLTPNIAQHITLEGSQLLRLDGHPITRALEIAGQAPVQLRIDPVAGSASLFGTNPQSLPDQVGVVLFIRAARNPADLLNPLQALQSAEGLFHDAQLPTAGLSLRAPVRLVPVGPTIPPPGYPSLQTPQSGVTFFTRTGVTFPGGQQANPADEAILQAGRDSVIGEFVIKPVLGFEQWAAVWITLHRGVRDAQGTLLPNTGTYTLGVNQQVISRRRNINLAAATLAELNSAATLNLPVLPGIRWQVTAPRSFRGNFAPLPTTIEHDFRGSDDLAWHWPVRFVTLAATLPNPGPPEPGPPEPGPPAPRGELGIPWILSGSASWTIDSYARERLHPWRHRLLTTLQPGQHVQLDASREVGLLPFNADGWATLMWPMLRPGGARIAVSVAGPPGSASGGDAPRTLATLDRLGLDFTDVAGLPQRIALEGGDDRYALAIHIHRSGQTHLTLINLTILHDESPSALPLTWSRRIQPLPGPVTSLGAVCVRVQADPAATNSTAAELDGLACYRTLTLAAADSYVSAAAGNNLTPAYYMAENNSAKPYSCLEDVYAATGFAPFAAIPRNINGSAAGMSRLLQPQAWQIAAVLGRPGRTLASWGPRFLSGLSETRGTRIILMGGFANDTARALTPTLAQQITQQSSDVLSQLAAWPIATDGHVTWIEPIFGSGSNFNTPFGPQVFEALMAHGRRVLCQTATTHPGRVSIAQMGPVSLDDGVHVGSYGESHAALNVLRTLGDRRICGIEPCGVADVGSEGAALMPDGVLDSNDFVVYLQIFFALDPAADFASEGGSPGADGQFDNNDFIVFIDAFFRGC